jgi:hypothetical protein
MTDIAHQDRFERGLVWLLIAITVLGALAGMKITPELPDSRQERFILFFPVALGACCALAPVLTNVIRKERIFSVGAIIATWCYCALMMIVIGVASCAPVANHETVRGPEITANKVPEDTARKLADPQH